MATGFCSVCSVARPICTAKGCGVCYACQPDHHHVRRCALPHCVTRARKDSAWCFLHHGYLPVVAPDDPFPLRECPRCAVGLHDCKGILDGCACACTRRRDCKCGTGGQGCVGGGEVLDIALGIAAMDPDRAA